MVPCHLLYTGKGTPLEPSEQARNQITYIAMLPTQLPTCFLADTFTDQLLLSMLIDSLIITLQRKTAFTLHSRSYVYIHLALSSLLLRTQEQLRKW